jgi:hypothetical protein
LAMREVVWMTIYIHLLTDPLYVDSREKTRWPVRC